MKTPKTILINELNWRQNQKQLEISEHLTQAHTLGDLSENADFYITKQHYKFNEHRMIEIKTSLNKHKPYQNNKNNRICLNCTVFLKTWKEKIKWKIYHIVQDTETHKNYNNIALSSLIAKSLLGKKEGDIIVIRTIFYKICLVKKW